MNHKNESICPCTFCRDDRNYRSMHIDYPLTEQEIRHTRKIIWKNGIKHWFKSIFGR